MNYTLFAFKSPEATIEETPSFYKIHPIIPEITPDLAATITRMCSKAITRIALIQKNLLKTSEQCVTAYQLDTN
jgi:hypothetical protein